MLCLSSVKCYKILFLAPFNAKSHWLFLENFVQALLERQHEVTCITSNTLAGSHPSNYTEILIEPPLDFESMSKYINSKKRNDKIQLIKLLDKTENKSQKYFQFRKKNCLK